MHFRAYTPGFVWCISRNLAGHRGARCIGIDDFPWPDQIDDDDDDVRRYISNHGPEGGCGSEERAMSKYLSSPSHQSSLNAHMVQVCLHTRRYWATGANRIEWEGVCIQARCVGGTLSGYRPR